MTATAQQLQLSLLAILVSLITICSLTYILWKQPESLRLSRDGVPFFTPQVVHPITGKAISVDELVQHFKRGG